MGKRLRVLHVSKAFFPVMGGIEQVIYQITTGLKYKVNSFVLTTRTWGGISRNKIDGIFVRRSLALMTLFSMPIALAYPFWFWAYARKVDVVDYHYPFPLIDVLIAIYFPKKTKLIVHWHSDIVAQKRLAKLLKPFFLHTLKRADKIIVATPIHVTSSLLLSDFADKCEVIPFGIDVDYWQNKTSDEILQIEKINQEYGKFILAVGRLVPYKGFEVLLQALKPDMKLVIIGTGKLEQILKKQAKELNSDRQVFFIGKQSLESLKCYLHACTVLAFPSVSENEAFGMVQLEAMACAKPIVNTALNSAVPWVARNQQEAITVTPRDIPALSSALQQLLTDDGLAHRLGEQGLLRVKQTFSVAQFQDKTYQVISRLCKYPISPDL
jgi:glycosyltransferase involved in cell wall biosynthesis